jgi:hypothetical protein
VKDWKACERRIAELFGGQRVPVSGRARGDAPDVAHQRLSIEVKSRKTLPAWLLDALAQAQAASGDERLPVAILHQDHKPYRDDLVVVGLADFVRMLEKEARG